MAGLIFYFHFMIPAIVTRVDLLLRRKHFIFGICIMLFTSCVASRDKDTFIEMEANNIDSNIAGIECIKTYDTVLSTIDVSVKYKNGKPVPGIPVALFNPASIQKYAITNSRGSALLHWFPEGEYRLQVGDPSRFPCINIRHLFIPGGRGCEASITLPTEK
jgi:hypothetical protein